VSKEVAEANEASDLVDVQSLAVRDLPQPLNVERESRVVPAHPASIHPQLAQVEQHPVVEMPLVDVGTDLAFVDVEILRRALRVEHEAVRDEVDRREVRLQAAAPALREVGVRRKTEHAFDDGRQDGLGQHLLVLPRAGPREIFAEMSPPFSSRWRLAGSSRSAASSVSCDGTDAACIRISEKPRRASRETSERPVPRLP
jgi:hypothetical protein